MKYNLKTKGNIRFLQIDPPKIALEKSRFNLMIKDLTGKLLVLLDGISLPNEIRLENLHPGKYMLILVSGDQYFSELISA